MGSREFCDNCGKDIPEGEKTKPVKLTIGEEVKRELAAVCESCQNRVCAFANNSFVTPRKTRKEKPAPAAPVDKPGAKDKPGK